MNRRVLLGISLLTILPFVHLKAEIRTWTSSDGKQIRGEIVDFDGQNLTIDIAGRSVTFPATRLSLDDQSFLKQWESEAPSRTTESDRPKTWPDSVEAPEDIGIEILEENSADRIFVYRSSHFEFRIASKLSKSDVAELAEIFEATYELLDNIPLELNGMLERQELLKVEFLETVEEFQRVSGAVGSTAYYTGGRDEKVYLAMAGIGAEKRGSRWVIDSDVDLNHLKWAITAQVTSPKTLNVPKWIRSGISSYFSIQKYRNGKYTLSRPESMIEDYVFSYTSSRVFPMVNLNRLMKFTQEEWEREIAIDGATRNFPSAVLLLYFFIHLDEPENEHFHHYLKAVENRDVDPDEAFAKHLSRGRDLTELSDQVKAALGAKGIRIEYEY